MVDTVDTQCQLLAYLDSGLGEWYAFAATHPHTEIFTPI